MVRVTTSGLPELNAKMDLKASEIAKFVSTVFAQASRAESDYLKTECMTGGTSPTQLGVRTGRLRASTGPLPVRQSGTILQTGIRFGTQYAATHIGKAGTVTTIKPIGHPFLAIPLPAARTAAGVARGMPEISWRGEHRSSPWGDTFIRRSQKGNLIIFGKKNDTRAGEWGRTRGKIIPLFVLKTEVKIPVRIPVEGIIDRLKEDVIPRLKEVL